LRNPLEKWPLGRSRDGWEGNIQVDLKEVGYGGGRWMVGRKELA
jgi:hypothetical protein